MAIGKFPFTFHLLRGAGMVTVNQNKQYDFFSFTINVNGKKGDETLVWNPTRKEVAENKVIRKREYSKEMFEAISGFWAIYND